MGISDLLLIGIPVAIWAEYFGHQPLVAFAASALAVLRLAAWMGHATEQVAIHSGPRLGGFLNGTFGGNALLVLGAAMVAGGLRHKEQHFNRNIARFNLSLMFMAVAAMVVPAVFHRSLPPIPDAGMASLSLIAALVLLGTYAASLIFSFRTHAHLFHTAGGHAAHAEWSKPKSFGMLAAATALVVVMSEVLVGSIEPVLQTLGWSELFVGVVVVALVGNAAEHSTAITMAMKGQMDVAIEIAVGSTTQIAMLVAPVAVLISWFIGRPNAPIE